MKAKIQGTWLDYDYSIDANHTSIDNIIDGHMEAQKKPIAYLGKSKAIEDNEGKVHNLRKRHLFFKFI